mmetsp:Transcript_44954/g.82123  ORF Transcript_44954/g.82123 Transcript_44954/m.82123 type:complete len:320 (+) Transcript_44954:87-1046(+)
MAPLEEELSAGDALAAKQVDHHGGTQVSAPEDSTSACRPTEFVPQVKGSIIPVDKERGLLKQARKKVLCGCNRTVGFSEVALVCEYRVGAIPSVFPAELARESAKLPPPEVGRGKQSRRGRTCVFCGGFACFAADDSVEQWSTSSRAWQPAMVTAVDEFGKVQLDAERTWYSIEEQKQWLRPLPKREGQKPAQADGDEGIQPQALEESNADSGDAGFKFYKADDLVEYWSASQCMWIPAEVIAVDDFGRVQLDVKPGKWLSIDDQEQKVRTPQRGQLCMQAAGEQQEKLHAEQAVRHCEVIAERPERTEAKLRKARLLG